MSVLSRPLFRQMGGPAQPTPQDMRQEVARVAQQLDYLQKMANTEPNVQNKQRTIQAIMELQRNTPPEILQMAQRLLRDTQASESPNIMSNPQMDPGNRSFVAPQNRAMGGEMMPSEQMMAQPQMDPEMARQAGVLEKAEMEAAGHGRTAWGRIRAEHDGGD